MYTGALAAPDRLAIRVLISPLEGAETPVFVLAEHLRKLLGRTDRTDDLTGAGASGLVTDQDRPGQKDLSTAQADRPSESLFTTQAERPPGSLFTAQGDGPSESLFTAQGELLTKLSVNQRKIIEICDVPHSLAAIMRALGVTGRGYFKQRHLDPLLRGGVLRMTHPDQPKHPGQAYVLTEAGVRLKAGDGSKQLAKADGSRTNGA